MQAGTYVRHPIGSSHEPWSVAGGTILVKLRQMSDTREQQRTVVDAAAWRREHPGMRARRFSCLFVRCWEGVHRWVGVR